MNRKRAGTITGRGVLPLTHSNITASAQDEGNRSMRKAGRKRWNHEDAMAAQAVIARLLPYWMAETFGMPYESAVARVKRDFKC